MKIINFSVNNYRCITGGLEQNTINFEGSNTIFIFGQNNTGKSSILNAYQLFYENDKPNQSDFYNKNETNHITVEIELEFTMSEKEKFRAKKEQAEKKYFYGEDNNRFKIQKTWKKAGQVALDLTYEQPASRFTETAFAGMGAHNFFKGLLPTPIFIEAMPNEATVEDKVNEILSIRVKEGGQNKEHEAYVRAIEAIRAYQKTIYDSDELHKYRDAINKWFTPLFPTIKLNITDKDENDIVTKAVTKSFTLGFDHLDDDNSIMNHVPNKFENIGHGAIRIALFNLFLLEDIARNKSRDNGDKNYIVLFEEPELFLHPNLTKQLREHIYKVSQEETPFQVVCASHSPQMIDLTKPKTSIVRMVKDIKDTHLYQVNEALLTDEKSAIKEEIYTALRFNPFICESFYADEVILIEGDTEAVLLRGYLQVKPPRKDLFVVNCGTVNNIPFFQMIFSKFHITYHLIFDCDGKCEDCADIYTVKKGIQKKIVDQYRSDKRQEGYQVGEIHVHHTTLEPAHREDGIPRELRLPEKLYDEDKKLIDKSKSLKADAYWRRILSLNLEHEDIDKVPIINAIKRIINFRLSS